MEHITTEQKLELVKQIRSKYNENISDIGQRERVLYGRSSYCDKSTSAMTRGDRSRYYDETDFELSSEGVAFGRIRFLIAVILLLGAIVLDVSEKKILGIGMDEVFTAISQDYEEEIAVWVNEVKEIEKIEETE